MYEIQFFCHSDGLWKTSLHSSNLLPNGGDCTEEEALQCAQAVIDGGSRYRLVRIEEVPLRDGSDRKKEGLQEEIEALVSLRESFDDVVGHVSEKIDDLEIELQCLKERDRDIKIDRRQSWW